MRQQNSIHKIIYSQLKTLWIINSLILSILFYSIVLYSMYIILYIN